MYGQFQLLAQILGSLLGMSSNFQSDHLLDCALPKFTWPLGYGIAD
jgi:hypothetical protein